MSASIKEAVALLLLALCWAATLTCSCLLVSISPLVAQILGASEALAPFTCGAFLLGAALASLPSTFLFSAFGRRGGFLFGALCGIAGGALGLIALRFSLPAVAFFISCALIGLAQGFGQFYRFAAFEVAPSRKPVAMALVLSGGVIAAFAGPQLALLTAPQTATASASEFEGSFIAMMALHLLNGILSACACLPPPGGQPTSPPDNRNAPLLADDGQQAAAAAKAAALAGDPPPRPTASTTIASSSNTPLHYNPWAPRPRHRSLHRILLQPQCLVAIGIGAASQTMMVVLMSPLALVMEDDGFKASTRTLTYELHFASMYAPGLISGRLLSWLGTFKSAALGTALLAASCAVLGTGASDGLHYMLGMSLCGLGWHLCFSAATLLLDETHSQREATNVQAANDLFVYLASATGSFGSGYLYAAKGRRFLVYLAAGLTAMLVPLLLAHGCCAWRKRRMQRINEELAEANAAADAAWAAQVTASMAAVVGSSAEPEDDEPVTPQLHWVLSGRRSPPSVRQTE